MTYLIKKFRSTQDGQILSRFATKLESKIEGVLIDLDLDLDSLTIRWVKIGPGDNRLPIATKILTIGKNGF